MKLYECRIFPLLSYSWKGWTRCTCSYSSAYWWWFSCVLTRKMQPEACWEKCTPSSSVLERTRGLLWKAGTGWPWYWSHQNILCSFWAVEAPWPWLYVLEWSCRAATSSGPWGAGGGGGCGLTGDFTGDEKSNKMRKRKMSFRLILVWFSPESIIKIIGNF